MQENEKTTVPIPSVGADGEQSLSYVTNEIITTGNEEINPIDESMEEMLRQMQRMSDPSYLATMTMSQLYDTVYESRLPVIDGLLYPGTYLFVGAPKVGKSFLMAQIAYHVSTGNTYKDNYVNNPIASDRLRYDVLYHTDLNRTHGKSNGLDLDRLNWSNYDLVVIDESHNFRNGGKLSGEDNEKENRYLKLLNKVIRKGVKTKVLMLSATPVNNRFNDLKNQLALAYEGNTDLIDDKLNTTKSIDDIFKNAQRAFNTWSKWNPADRTTENLLRMLDFDFFEVLDSVTIARSRKHIQKYYDTSDIGTFPTRLKPICWNRRCARKMKFNFKIQQYQTDAVDAVVKVFQGQGYHDKISYIRDVGKKQENQQMRLNVDTEDAQQFNLYDMDDDTGYKNEIIELSDEQLLINIQKLQSQNNIKQSKALVKDLGRCSLDIEMETGTGKTYVYIKTMFELNKKYGWSKFIVVVPSIAIREGVKKTFEITADHFMEHYGKKARFFVYNSSNLNQLDNFSSSSGINVMIINTQAFASSLKEDGRSKEARIIYSKRDEFGSRRPIDVIKANRPIIILDEPQKMGGAVTQKALKNFNPLFTLNYSATHAVQHNTVYVLDALDAFNKRLVKKIEVKGFEVKNFRGTDSYMFLEQIVLSSKKPPMARIELEIGYNKSINRETRVLGVGDDLYYVSQEMEQYKGYTISDIDPFRGTVTFTNGEVIQTGEVSGDVSESDMRRIQIRETILSHFEKEEKLFNMGIKSLSLGRCSMRYRRCFLPQIPMVWISSSRMTRHGR